MSDQEFDKQFEDAANEQDFLFSMSSWDKAEAILDRNDPRCVDAALAAGIASADFQATEAGFESAMSRYSAMKTRRRRRKFAWWTGAALVAILLTIGGMQWIGGGDTAIAPATTPASTTEKNEESGIEEPTRKSIEVESKSEPNAHEIAGDAALEQSSGTQADEKDLPSGQNLPANTLNPPTTASIEDKTGGVELATNGSIDNPAEMPAVDVVEHTLPLLPDAVSECNLPNYLVELEAIEPRAIPTDENNDVQQILVNSDFDVPASKKGVSPEGVHDWALIAAGRSMRLADVPDGFDLTKYSPEFGVRYARRLDDQFSFETELTGYFIAGTQGSVTFARSVYGMGEATQVRYIEAGQSLQLEVPVRIRYRLADRHFMACGLSVTYMLPAQVKVSEELQEWYDVEQLDSYQTYGYVYGMRRWNISWSVGYQFRLNEHLSLNTAVNYYILDRDLLDSEALAPVPWQVRVGVHYSLFR
ncbi:MAG: hypothetical protein J4F31_06550 [Flavobacteriales bacterium]|nr:hypothetical protein [Flavobacteriales bacterium]